MNKVALIIGVTGQDGAYLSKFLLGKGYEVHGIRRSSSTGNTSRLDFLLKNNSNISRFHLHYGDVTDQACLSKYISELKPAEIYNLAAQSHVHVSFQNPEYTAITDGVAVLKVLEAIRILSPESRFYQASTSELYGLVQHPIQSETTPFYPRSPYGVAKLYAYWICKNYREAYKLFASNGILFNHESPIRGSQFVTRKITRGLARLALGLQDELRLGNLDAKRDWGHAEDYVEAMWKILQVDKPDDFVIATGKTTSVREFVEKVCLALGISIGWRGTGINEVGYVKNLSRDVYESRVGGGVKLLEGCEIIKIDPFYYRPTEVDLLHGDASKAKIVLDWTPKRSLDELIDEMIDFDILVATKEKNAGIACHLDTV